MMKKITILFLFFILIDGLSVFAQIPTSGLIGYWPFTGNANDISGNTHNGVVYGATLTNDRFGNPNSAYSFNGNGDYIQVSTIDQNTFSNDFSISVWVNFNNYDNNYPYIIWGENNFLCLQGFGPVFTTNHKKIGFYTFSNTSVQQPGPNFYTSDTVATHNWHHVLVNKSATTISIYIDNILSNTNTSYQNIALTTGSSIVFGRGYITLSPSIYTIDGSLDDIRIYNRALNTSEISSIYNENTGLNSIILDRNFKIFPNPTNGNITIDFGCDYTKKNGCSIKITNLLGQIVYTSNVSQQQMTIDLSTMTDKGIYFIHLIDTKSNIVDVRKIILQ